MKLIKETYLGYLKELSQSVSHWTLPPFFSNTTKASRDWFFISSLANEITIRPPISPASGFPRKFKMADKTTASPVEILDFWMTFAMRNPTQREKAAQEISKVLKSPGTSYTNVKIALEFYKHVHRFAFNSVIHEPVLESLRTEDILQPEMDPFMSRLLFQSVTNSSTECVEYCTEIWLER